MSETDGGKNRRISQIIPGSGHLAVYFDEETGEPWCDFVLGWALVEETDEPHVQSRVVGLVAGEKEIVLVDEYPNFLGYMQPDGSLNDWQADAEEAWSSYRDGDSVFTNAMRRR